MTRRFAIYVAPGAGSADTAPANTAPANAKPTNTAPTNTAPADTVGVLLRQKAEQWLGRSVSGDCVTPGAPVGWTRAAVDAMTVNARRYGFHATLKPPFRLSEGCTAEELDAAVARLAAGSAAAVIPQLSLARLGGFFALVPGAEAPGLRALADEVVKGLDDFRAPATGGELARRNPASLTPRQRELLTTWGYPYVLDEFSFHLTVTDRIPHQQQPEVERALSDWFAPLLGADVPVNALALFTEAAPGTPFTLHALHHLQPPPEHRRPAELADSEGAR